MPEETVQQQPELPLPFPELAGDMPLLPARMLNEYQGRGLIEAGSRAQGP